LGHYIVKMKPDVIVNLADFADMPSLCSYDEGKKDYEGRRYAIDIAATREAMGRLLGPLWAFNENARKNHEALYTPEMHLTLGNHEQRIIRAIQKEARLDGTISIKDLGYEEFGWTVHPYLHPVIIDGVAYSHFFPSGPKGLPIGTAKKLLTELHCSAVAGHTPGRDIAYDTHASGRQMTAIIAGSFYVDDQGYVDGPQKHWRGFYMLHDVVDGDFDEMAVSIRYLARTAEKEGWK